MCALVCRCLATKRTLLCRPALVLSLGHPQGCSTAPSSALCNPLAKSHGGLTTRQGPASLERLVAPKCLVAGGPHTLWVAFRSTCVPRHQSTPLPLLHRMQHWVLARWGWGLLWMRVHLVLCAHTPTSHRSARPTRSATLPTGATRSVSYAFGGTRPPVVPATLTPAGATSTTTAPPSTPARCALARAAVSHPSLRSGTRSPRHLALSPLHLQSFESSPGHAPFLAPLPPTCMAPLPGAGSGMPCTPTGCVPTGTGEFFSTSSQPQTLHLNPKPFLPLEIVVIMRKNPATMRTNQVVILTNLVIMLFFAFRATGGNIGTPWTRPHQALAQEAPVAPPLPQATVTGVA